ncbi:hypothetical protein SMICM17S_09167 [Streptomyces microflavus]
MAEQLLGEQSGQRLAVEAGEVGELGVEHVVQGLAHDRVVPADPHHAEPGEHVEVVVALRVPEVRPLGPLVELVEADGVQHARQLVVEVARMQLVPLGPALRQEPSQVEALGPAVRHRPYFSFGTFRGAGATGPLPSRCHRLLVMVSRAARRDSFSDPMVASTAVGSYPQCAMQLAQRGSLPRPYFSQSVSSMSWRYVGT